MSTAAVMDERTDWPSITVVSAAGHVHRATAQAGWWPPAVAEPKPGETFRWYTSAAYSELAHANDEGITWIRGWHDDDSEAVRAMLAARALVQKSTVVDLKEAEDLYMSGKWDHAAWVENFHRWNVEFDEAMGQK
jgi:hypothetical protein